MSSCLTRPVSVLLEVLRQSCEVTSMCPPVGAKVIEPGCVRSPGGEEGDSAGPTHCLNMVSIVNHVGLSTC